MLVRASIVIMSHLSDLADITFDFSEKRDRINFIKFLILRYPDTSVEIDPDAEYDLYLYRHKR
jgi:hypothetical protein